MRLLRLAIEKQRWDLAAHTIVLATAKILHSEPRKINQRGGDRPHVTRGKEKNKRIKAE